ncbi:hypothetical protein BU25DRAFT_66644 [Macroventuria anomochaeta]|uniref:Uncharacterized protein n=1 Tax=Macroventuria anomochaeta TaxID=301207 RepID=A0ACB6RYE3_9PLEO|nr:uncharacterized protein BU25DRAFT_66644 [Macroventuria anomochaeta]KAF2627000.1 hypothetical protein BU25DRAFT_66644 [Macroventuria anomochaeta]
MRVSTVILTIAAAVAAQDTYTATGAGCEPHNDHWHCPAGVAEPTTAPAAEASVDTVSATVSGVCEPHNDHWHCPSGVAEPTYAPSAAPAVTSAISGSITSAPAASASHSHNDEDDHSHAVTAATCEPHNDHWHCPSGVAEPTTAPAQTRSTSRASTASGAGASGSASASTSQFAGAGSAVGASQQGFVAVVLGAVGAFFL